MVEVVRMSAEREASHLDKILDRLASAQRVKADYIVKNRCVIGINGKIEEILIEHKFYKEAYGL